MFVHTTISLAPFPIKVIAQYVLKDTNNNWLGYISINPAARDSMDDNYFKIKLSDKNSISMGGIDFT